MVFKEIGYAAAATAGAVAGAAIAVVKAPFQAIDATVAGAKELYNKPVETLLRGPQQGFDVLKACHNRLKAVEETIDGLFYGQENTIGTLPRWKDERVLNKISRDIQKDVLRNAPAFQYITTVDEFDTLIKERETFFTGWKPCGDKPANEFYAKKVQEEIDKQKAALIGSTTASKKTFDDLNDYLKSGQCNQDGALDYLHELNASTKTALEAQYEADKTAIEALYGTAAAPTPFRENLGKALNITDPVQLNETIENQKTETLKKLEDDHKASLKKFEETMQQRLEFNHAQAQIARDQYFFFQTHYQIPAMKEAIDDLLSQKNLNKGGITLSSSSDPNNPDDTVYGLEHLSVKDLLTITTLTGSKITKVEDGKYTLKHPSHFLGFSNYYNSVFQKPVVDHMTMAMAIRACGYQDITMKVTHGHMSDSLEMARCAYEGCRRAGYTDDHITIEYVVMGADNKPEYKTVKAGEFRDILFATCPSRFDEINKVDSDITLTGRADADSKAREQEAKEAKAKWAGRTTDVKEESVRKFKEGLAAHKASTAAAAAASTTPGSGPRVPP